jgi:hypothetical protein
MKKPHTSWCVCANCKKKEETICRFCSKPFERHKNGRIKPCKCSGK